MRPGDLLRLAGLSPLVAVAVAVVVVSRRPGPEEGEGVGSRVVVPARVLGEGWTVESTEAYGPSTLHHKVNGAAEMYLAHGFRGLVSTGYAHRGGSWLEVLAFDLGDQARDLYVRERPAGVEEDSTWGGYATGSSAFLAVGSWYVQILGSQDSLAQAASRSAARYLRGVAG